MKYDALVIGSGISGMESALKLGDMGYKVLVVEKEASVGGKMILLSKVFPTLDCASCISTPKMGATIHHPNLDGAHLLRGGQHRAPERRASRPRSSRRPASWTRRPAPAAGSARWSAAWPCPTSSTPTWCRAGRPTSPSRRRCPRRPSSSGEGTSPCTYTCPAGIKAHGYVALTRSGEYEKAFQLVADATPLVGSLGRACYAPCEEECTRGDLEGPVNIRRIKRFLADTHYAKPRVAPEKPAPNGKKVAVVGSGPAGLTAAWHLARKGYEVKIFEAAPLAGGMLRLALPPYRLPSEVVDEDVANVTDLGVTIVTDTKVEDLEALKAEGYDAVLVAIGTHLGTKLRVPGEDLQGVTARHRVPPGRQARRAARGGGQARGGHRRRQRGHRRGPHRAPPEGRFGARCSAWNRCSRCRPTPAGDRRRPSRRASPSATPAACATSRATDSVRSIVPDALRVRVRREGPLQPQVLRQDARAPSSADLVIVAAGMRPDSGEFGLPINPSGTIRSTQRHPADRAYPTCSPRATWCWARP